MKTSVRVFAALASAALFATACGDAPDSGETPSATEPTTTDGTETGSPTDDGTAAADYTACQVTDTGGVDDRSFNQTAFKGLQDAEAEFGIQSRVLESEDTSDFEPHIQEFLASDCNMIVTVGFLLDAATQAAAEANPDQQFAIVDVDFAEFDADGNYVGDVTFDNVKELTFQTDEAAFLAGYLAAGMTETGVVGTYGGLNIPTVTIFMNGFLAGVRHHNEVKGTAVEVLGWDGQDGLFTETFEEQQAGRNITDQLLAQNADIILPVAGPVGLGSAAALQEAGTGSLIWVDSDGFESTDFGSLMLTSIQKKMDEAVLAAISESVGGTFAGGLYVGTLENGGVDIAPYHEYEDDVPQELKDEIEALRAEIIAGTRSVLPADYPA